MKRALFVCTGNICRSPTAEAVFRYKIEEQGLSARIAVESAGTYGYHVGDPPDYRSIETAAQRGVSMDGQSARKVSLSDFEDFDLILAMDESHYEALISQKPEGSKSVVALFLDYYPGHEGRGVPDPYYGEQSGFDHVFDLIDGCVDHLIKHLLEE